MSRCSGHAHADDAGVITGLRMRTGFAPMEIFRKYMWYLLRERAFDQAAVDDMIHLKQALGLKDDQVRSQMDP